LTGALLDRLTHHVHILEMNGPSYRLQHSQAQQQVQQKVKGQKHAPVQHREDTEEGDNSATVREPVEMSSG
jgi:hypothetical protein